MQNLHITQTPREAHLLELLRVANAKIAALERGGSAGEAALERAREAILEGAELHGLGDLYRVQMAGAWPSEPE